MQARAQRDHHGSDQPEVSDMPHDFARERTPGGAWWLEEGRLLGIARPGMLGDANAVFDWLARHGVRHLVCLERECGCNDAMLATRGIARHPHAVADMGAPSTTQAIEICGIADAAHAANRAVAVHCRSGLGRTGTVLAAVLVWRGSEPATAIARVRAVQPYAVQSLVQYHFVHELGALVPTLRGG